MAGPPPDREKPWTQIVVTGVSVNVLGLVAFDPGLARTICLVVGFGMIIGALAGVIRDRLRARSGDPQGRDRLG